VVLTFSGNWCGPCVGMYPQERDVVNRLKDQPFAMVSVNTDASVETLAKSIKAGEITWRCWWDGGTTGPITTRWGVSSFPTIFVLDQAGVIRYKDVRGVDLDKAVELLLAGTGARTSSPR
jgi:thiol-disulfide isomerase/thioredoxin